MSQADRQELRPDRQELEGDRQESTTRGMVRSQVNMTPPVPFEPPTEVQILTLRRKAIESSNDAMKGHCDAALDGDPAALAVVGAAWRKWWMAAIDLNPRAAGTGRRRKD